MQATLKVCKLLLLLSLGLSTKASPILTGLKTIPSDYQQSGLSFHQEYSFSSNPGHENFEIKSNVQPSLAFDQNFKNAPSVTKSFIDQNGHLVTQVKKETVNNNNGQNAHALEIEETKQLPNGYSKSFKKEYSSSSVIQSQPTTFNQEPSTVDKYYTREKPINTETSQFGQYSQNYQGSLVSGNSDYFGIKSNLKPTIGESMTNVPAVTSVYKDQNGNLVTQVKKETVNNNNGQNAHALEIEETKQLPNGYSKSFKKEYSSSSVIQSQPTTFNQEPSTVDKYYTREKPINTETSQFGQYSQNYQGSLVSGNSDYFGIKSNLKPTIGESMTNVPAVTSVYKDQNGNLVTQVKKETVNNNNGQNAHALEIEETKQLPNGYSKSFKKEYSSSSVIQSQPTTFNQEPSTVDKYYTREKPINTETSQFGQYSQNYQGSLVSGNSDYFGIKSNLKPTIGESMTNVPAVTSVYKDQNGNLVTQVKKETVNNNNGQNAHALEIEETKQLPNGYSKSFKKEYSSSSVIQSQPTTFNQEPSTVDKYYTREKPINTETSQFGQYSQNYQGSLVSGNSDYFGIKSNLKPTIGESMTNVPAVTSVYKDQNGNLVTQVKKETVNNNNGQNAHALEIEETKQLPNGYSKSFKKEYSSSSVIQSQPTTFNQEPSTVDKYYTREKPINTETSQFGQYSQNYQGSLVSGNSDYFGIKSNLKPTIGESMTNVPAVTSVYKDQNGNLVTQVKKETVNNNNGQNAHALEIEETKQLPNGYSKSFKKEYYSSSDIGSYPTRTEIQTSIPQKFTAGEIEKFNGYNTFFNNQKQPLNPNGPINSQIINNKKSIYAQDINKANSFGYNSQDHVDCDENESSLSSYQSVKQQAVNLNSYSKPSLVNQQSVNINLPENMGQESVDLHAFSKPSKIGQESVNIDNIYKPNKPEVKPTGQHQIEQLEYSSKQTQNIGQESADLHAFSKPSQMGQESVNIDNIFKPNKPDIKPTGQHQIEKFEFSSTQTENVGQESVDLHAFSKPSQIGQESVNIDNIYKPNKPEVKPTGQHQIEQFEYSSKQTQNIGQESVDLQAFSKPSQIGQESVNIDNIYKPNKPEVKPTGQHQIEQFEYSSKQTQNIGQESVDLQAFSKPSQIGQESVNIDNIYKPNKPEVKPTGQNQIEKFEFSSTQTENVGQESVDLHAFSKPSKIGQESVNIDNIYKPNKPDIKPTGQHQIEQFEYSSKQTQNIGQESVDLHAFSKPSQIGQESVNIDNIYKPNKPEVKPTGQHQIEKFEFSSTQTENVGQESVDLHAFSKPSQIGQESVNIDNIFKPNKPDIKPTGQHQIEQFEYSSKQTQNIGQESVDLHAFSKPSQIGQESVNIDNIYKPNKPEVKPTGQHQIEKFEFSSTQTENVGQESVDLHAFSKPSQIGQESVDIDYMYTPKKPEIKPTGLQFEKLESSYQNKYSSVAQQPININTNSQSSQQFVSQPTTGQQIQGLEFLTSNYGDTTHLLDLGIGGQTHTKYIKGSTSGQQNVNNEKLLTLSKPKDQQQAVVFERQSTIEKNIDLNNLENLQTNVNNNYQTLHGQSMKIPVLQGQQTIEVTSDFEGNKPTYHNHYASEGVQKSEFSSQNGKLNTGNDQSINFKYNTVFDKLGQLEHEILAPKSTVNMNKDNFQTSYSTNHYLKSMPQTSQQVSSISKTFNENTQYIEPQSEIISTNLSKKETESVVQQDTIENHEHFMENPTTQSSLWKKFGDKVKGTIQNAKTKAQQLASTINGKVGFSKNNESDNPC